MSTVSSKPASRPAAPAAGVMAKGKKNGSKIGSKGMSVGARQASVASAYATTQSTGKAQVYRNGYDSCRIVHRELVGSVTGSVNFAVGTTFSVNPGLQASFPWLSTQAVGWEKYRFNNLRLCAYTRTGSTTPGSLILSPDYDPADAAPVNEQVASAAHGAIEDAPWKDICFQVDKKMLNVERFIRTGGLAANQDIKTYDLMNLHVCTIDGTAVAWSKLWFEYDITLIHPQLPPAGALATGTLISGGGTIAAATPFGAVPVATGSFNLSGAATNVLSLAGLSIGTEYSIAMSSSGTVISAYSFAATTGLTLKGTSFAGFPSAATSAAQTSTFTATAANATVTLSVTATTVTSTSVVVAALVPTPTF